jgi:hypothetical protein
VRPTIENDDDNKDNDGDNKGTGNNNCYYFLFLLYVGYSCVPHSISFITFMLQMRKLRKEQVEWLCPGHTWW